MKMNDTQAFIFAAACIYLIVGAVPFFLLRGLRRKRRPLAPYRKVTSFFTSEIDPSLDIYVLECRHVVTARRVIRASIPCPDCEAESRGDDE